MGLKNPYHPYNKMSVYTVNDDNSFFDEKTIVCSQKLNRIFQLRLITLYWVQVQARPHLLSELCLTCFSYRTGWLASPPFFSTRFKAFARDHFDLPQLDYYEKNQIFARACMFACVCVCVCKRAWKFSFWPFTLFPPAHRRPLDLTSAFIDKKCFH